MYPEYGKGIQEAKFKMGRRESHPDRHMVERGVLKSEMAPGYHGNLFLALLAFGHEITLEKMGVTPGEKATILEKIQAIAYSRNAQSYQSQCDRLYEVMLDIVRNYYD